MIDETDLPRIQSRILQTVRKEKGITAPALVDKIYQDEEDGGPMHAMMVIQVTINKLNDRLKGFRIKSTGRGRGALYRLEKL